ncbi:ABC transporter substrate-binding protein [Acetobacter conturbans]|uniref:Transporter substrate-binding domain-containing protein n=1 Tax=Acetobacter conturbans TaxID=1737472 RepID=A0ABX0K680_9PROT|nr:ABC transporter substrate-binding protein [Acetobacter conturbans]NHN90115.1 transporter substrate-binding domain-containing protein [Acetobacter conturbans]
MTLYTKCKRIFIAAALATLTLPPLARAESLHVGYSDWPGSVAWQIAIEKHWLEEKKLDITFEWFDYGAMLDAYIAGKLDAISATNGDVLSTGANGRKSVIVMLNDYSDGNDMIVATRDISNVADLKGKKIAVETGLVDHLLLLTALQKNGLSEEDVNIVRTTTNETPQVLATGTVAAIGVWQPNAGQALRMVSGSHPIFTSHDAPGLIYDSLAVDPVSLRIHENDWRTLVQIWGRIVAYIQNPATHDDAVKIMAKKVGISPETYARFLAGTHLLSLDDNAVVFEKKPGLNSIYGSTQNADNFNVRYKAYASPQQIDSYIHPLLKVDATTGKTEQ